MNQVNNMMEDEDFFNYSDIENDDDEEFDDANTSSSSCEPTNASLALVNMLESYDWAAALSHVTNNPSACCSVRCVERRTALHLACHHDAPAVVIQAMLKAYPEASVATGTSNMNPLHVTCSSPHASAHVVRVLHELGRIEQFSMRDIDGDTPLHAACRCGASTAVVGVLLRAYPAAVTIRDYEGLTPLQRLWVRYFVILGADAIQSVKTQADLSGELLDAWNKTEVLLQAVHAAPVVHAAAAVDAPRPIVRIAAALYPHQLRLRDGRGRTPLMVACQSPVYPVRDLSDAGYRDVLHDDDVTTGGGGTTTTTEDDQCSSTEPSVIGVLLQANQSDASQGACVCDPSGRLPLHMALETQKTWDQGVGDLIQAFPESLCRPDQSSQLLPYQIAAVHHNNGDLSTVYAVLRSAPHALVVRRQTTTKQTQQLNNSMSRPTGV